MALNIKNSEVERLLEEVTALTGETKTEVVRKALEERRRRLALEHFGQQRDATRLRLFLEDEVWPQIPAHQVGVRLSKEEEETILGYGESGV